MRTFYCVALVVVISLGMTSRGMGHPGSGHGQLGGHTCGHSADLGAEACGAPNYGTLDLAPGCCEFSPSCCDDVWAGYCQERDDWKEFIPRRFRKNQGTCACGATIPCGPGFCPFFSLFGWALPTVGDSICDAGSDQPQLEVIIEMESENEDPTPTVEPAPEPAPEPPAA